MNEQMWPGLKGVFYFDAFSYSRDLVSIYSISIYSILRLGTAGKRRDMLNGGTVI